MRMNTKFDLTPDINTINRFNPNSICVQDTIHIGTKLRNRLINSSVELKIGNRIATVAHIKMLLTHPKEVHGLVYSDVIPDDRQNYGSLEKIMHPRVISTLKNEIVDSEATVVYLTLCDQITSSFVQTDLSPIDRVYKLWNAVYFLRCWRKSIILSKILTLTENFITTNAYTCIEVNAQALIELIVKLRSSQAEDIFMPNAFASQPCENTFRQMRSMGTANFTKINFNLNELLHMIARTEIMNKVIYSNNEIVFPRKQIKSKDQLIKKSSTLPTDQQISDTMKKALLDALENAAQFGIHFTVGDIMNIDAELHIGKMDEDQELISQVESDMSDLENIPESDPEASSNVNSVDSYIDVIDLDGTAKKIRKSTFLWMQSDSKATLSSDRLKRVQDSSSANPNKKFKHDWKNTPNLVKMKEIFIGDWIVFKCSEQQTDADSSDYNGYLIASVYGFKYIKEKKRRKFKYNHLEIDHPDSSQIEIIGNWYRFSEDKKLRIVSPIPAIVNNYIGTLKDPIVNKNLDKNVDKFHENLFYTLPCEYHELKQFIVEIENK